MADELMRRILAALTADPRLVLTTYEVRAIVEEKHAPTTYDIRDIFSSLDLLQEAGHVHEVYVRQQRGDGDFMPVGWMLLSRKPLTDRVLESAGRR